MHDYIEKCPRCGAFLTAEQAKDHKCSIPLKGVKEIPILFHYECKKDNGDVIIMARGLNGILYRLVESKKSIRRNFTDDESDEDLTEPNIDIFIKV